jgi:hypothetical protein
MDSQLGGHLDVSRRFGEDRRFGLRLNGSTQLGTPQSTINRGMSISVPCPLTIKANACVPASTGSIRKNVSTLLRAPSPSPRA